MLTSRCLKNDLDGSIETDISLPHPSLPTAPCPLWWFLQLVSLLLIGIAAWGIGFGLISSLRVVGVVIAVGIFLFLIALVGLIGAVKHHQVLLFFVSFLEVGFFNPDWVYSFIDFCFDSYNEFEVIIRKWTARQQLLASPVCVHVCVCALSTNTFLRVKLLCV